MNDIYNQLGTDAKLADIILKPSWNDLTTEEQDAVKAYFEEDAPQGTRKLGIEFIVVERRDGKIVETGVTDNLSIEMERL